MSANRREELLNAAKQIVERDGFSRLTLDSVAAECGVSKGGVLYHFPTKAALLKGLVEDLIRCSEEEHEQHLSKEPESAGRWTRAYIRSGMDGDPMSEHANLGFIAAFASDPSLMDTLSQRFDTYQEAVISDGLDPTLATILRLATDGLWLSELFRLAPPVGDFKAQLVERMVQMATPNGEACA